MFLDSRGACSHLVTPLLEERLSAVSSVDSVIFSESKDSFLMFSKNGPRLSEVHIFLSD